jgi:hypothetical protein
MTDREPEAGSVPMPAIVISAALLVCHVSMVGWPCSITSGLAARVAVGAAGGGGVAGGVTLATFLLQPARENRPASAASSANVFSLLCVTFILLNLENIEFAVEQ